MRLHLASFVLAAGVLTGCAIDSAPPTGAHASGATVATVVTESEIVRQAENTAPTGPWVLYTRNAGTGAFQTGPGTPPSGAGSLGLSTPGSGDKAYLFNFEYVGTALADITSLRYATYRTAGASPVQVPSINLQVDSNGPADGGFTTLVFEPVYNTRQGAVVDGRWQTWDAYAGGDAVWWSSRDIHGVCATSCYVTWNQILAANPDAVILGGVGLNQGSGNPALVASVDAFTVGVDGSNTTYDFEPYRTPSTRGSCMKGGWQTLRRADGSAFRNQGDCVSYVGAGR